MVVGYLLVPLGRCRRETVICVPTGESSRSQNYVVISEAVLGDRLSALPSIGSIRPPTGGSYPVFAPQWCGGALAEMAKAKPKAKVKAKLKAKAKAKPKAKVKA